MTNAKVQAGQRQRLHPSLSCVTCDPADGRDGMGSLNYFDVPDEEYCAGCRTGQMAFFDALIAAKEAGECYVEDIAGAAHVILVESKNKVELYASKRGAAVGFLSTMGDAMQAFAKGATVEQFMQSALELEQSCGEADVKEAQLDAARRVQAIAEASRRLMAATPKHHHARLPQAEETSA